MKKVVIDTNVLIFSVFSSQGAPARIMEMVSDKEVQLLYNAEILEEYMRVMAYERLKIEPYIQQGLAHKVIEPGVLSDSVKSDISLPDESDRCFYDVAKTNGATLVTYNEKHFPKENSIEGLNCQLLLRAIEIYPGTAQKHQQYRSGHK